MPPSARLCPYCRKLNSAGDTHCYHCERRLPSAAEARALSFFRGALGADYPVTKILAALSVIVYVAMVVAGGAGLNRVRFSEALRWGALVASFDAEPLRYLSAMFVHFNLLHVGMNSLYLVFLGRDVEGSLGGARLLIAFLLSGVCGFVVSSAWQAGWVFAGGGAQASITGGISGGIFGLLGLAIGWRLAEKDPAWKRMAINAVAYALLAALLMGGSVNNAAHLGGLASGVFIGWGLWRWGRGPAASVWLRRTAYALAVTTAFSIVNSHVSPLWKMQRAAEQRSMGR